MKKMFALLMTLMIIISAAALPAIAEEGQDQTDTVTSATVPNGRGNRQGMPQAPGKRQDGQQPQQPGSQQDGQQPQQPGSQQDGQQSGMPRGGKNTQKARNGRMHNAESWQNQIFDQLLKDGVITQEVYDAIMTYLKEHLPTGQPEAPSQTDGTGVPALPEGQAPAEGETPPALPENPQPEEESAEEQLLKDLLERGVITQEQYDLLCSAMAGKAPSDL